MSIEVDLSCARLILRPQTSQWLIDIGGNPYALPSTDDAIELMPHFPIRIIDESKTTIYHEAATTAELIGTGTPDVLLKIARDGETAIIPFTGMSSGIPAIDCVHGKYEDGWLDIQALFVIYGSGNISFDVFIPELPNEGSKIVRASLNDGRPREFDVPRGGMVTIGPLQVVDDVCEITLVSEKEEPHNNTGDLRSLGVMLVRVSADGQPVRPHNARHHYLIQCKM